MVTVPPAVGPFVGSAKQVGKNLVQNTPIPASVSFPLSGVEGSLTSETLNWLKVTFYKIFKPELWTTLWNGERDFPKIKLLSLQISWRWSNAIT